MGGGVAQGAACVWGQCPRPGQRTPEFLADEAGRRSQLRAGRPGHTLLGWVGSLDNLGALCVMNLLLAA